MKCNHHCVVNSFFDKNELAPMLVATFFRCNATMNKLRFTSLVSHREKREHPLLSTFKPVMSVMLLYSRFVYMFCVAGIFINMFMKYIYTSVVR